VGKKSKAKASVGHVENSMCETTCAVAMEANKSTIRCLWFALTVALTFQAVSIIYSVVKRESESREALNDIRYCRGEATNAFSAIVREGEQILARIAEKEKQLVGISKTLDEQKTTVGLYIKLLDTSRIGDAEGALKYTHSLLSMGVEDWLVYDYQGNAAKVIAKKYAANSEKRKAYMEEALEAYKKAANLNGNESAANVAEVYAELDQEEECKAWLITAQQSGYMPERTAINGSALTKYSKKPWFQTMEWKEYR